MSNEKLKEESLLPDGWQIKKLGDVCDLQNGFAFKSKSYVEFSNTLNIRMSNIRPDGSFNPEHNIRFLPDMFALKHEQFLLNEGDLIIAMTDMAGDPKILGLPTIVKNLNDRNFLLNQRVGKLIDFCDEIHIPYLKYYLGSPVVKDYYKSKGAGGLQLNISKKDILTASIPVPPLAEQERIVGILDEACEAIDKAKENAEQNLKNAKELFQSKLQSIFDEGKSKVQTGEWQEKTLGEITDVEYGYTDKSSEDGDYRYIRITDIDKNGELILETKKYINDSSQAQHFLLKDNDLLMARTGATFAKVLLYKAYEPSVFASYLIRINFKEEIENELYWYFTKTDSYWKQANSLSSGAAQPHFNGAALKQVVFLYPKSVRKQQILIESFKLISSETKKLELIYQYKLDNLQELRNSILQKAFNGEL